MKKIKISCNWDNDINITNRFIDTFCNENVIDKYEITYNNDYDYHIVFNYCHGYTDFSKTICFTQEPSWSAHIKPDFLRQCKNVFFHDNTLLGLPNIIESPSIMFPHIRGNISDLASRPHIKTKKMSFVCSGLVGNNNYNFRSDLFKKLLETDLDIDFYGYGWEGITDSRYKGAFDNKEITLSEYEFSIAIENSCEKGYTTEKFFDCLLCNTIPIYFGNPNIDNIYPKDSFLKLIDTNIETAVETIKYIHSNKKYNDYLPTLIEGKNKYLTDYNVLNIISRLG